MNAEGKRSGGAGAARRRSVQPPRGAGERWHGWGEGRGGAVQRPYGWGQRYGGSS